MSEDDEDVINATVIEPSSNLKRSRKLVTKTYMDENGYVGVYMLTSFTFYETTRIVSN